MAWVPNPSLWVSQSPTHRCAFDTVDGGAQRKVRDADLPGVLTKLPELAERAIPDAAAVSVTVRHAPRVVTH
jgi:hypothetical protein